jgi:hypothetical protein
MTVWPRDGEEAREECVVRWSRALCEALDGASLAESARQDEFDWRERVGAPWSAARQGGPRWVASWDENGWDGPCLRVVGYDHALLGQEAFAWARLGGRLFQRTGSGLVSDRDGFGGNQAVFVSEYRLIAGQDRGLGSKILGSLKAPGLDLDGPLRTMALREEQALAQAAKEPLGRPAAPRL